VTRDPDTVMDDESVEKVIFRDAEGNKLKQYSKSWGFQMSYKFEIDRSKLDKYFYQPAFSSCAFSISWETLDAFNDGEYDELLAHYFDGGWERGRDIAHLRDGLKKIQKTIDIKKSVYDNYEQELKELTELENEIKEKLLKLEGV